MIFFYCVTKVVYAFCCGSRQERYREFKDHPLTQNSNGQGVYLSRFICIHRLRLSLPTTVQRELTWEGEELDAALLLLKMTPQLIIRSLSFSDIKREDLPDGNFSKP